MTIWIIIGFIYGTWLLTVTALKIIERIKTQQIDKIYERQREKEFEYVENIQNEKNRHAQTLNTVKDQLNDRFEKYKEEVRESLDVLVQEKSLGFPWLSNAIADYYENYDLIFAKHLKSKIRPAISQSERIKKIAEEKKLFKKEFLTAKYIINYYETLFPWLKEYVGFNSDELIKSIYSEDSLNQGDDLVPFYVPEYKTLSVEAASQKALDRYWNRNKSPWEIGRDYERYIGYLYEMNNFQVEYHGIEKIKGDLGRDLICIKADQIEIVQCKYWSSQKGFLIRENHITQLYGTTIKYFIEHRKINNKIQMPLFPDLLKKSNIQPVLVTTTELSETAKEFAKVLGIRVDKILMETKYPCIKCNINFQTNAHIYHLPFDQQYDNTMIDVNKGECWVQTVREAELLGFRRAWRWRPSKE